MTAESQNLNLGSDEEYQNRFLLTMIRFINKNTFSILSDCLPKEIVVEVVDIYKQEGLIEIKDSRSKEMTMKKSEIISVMYGGVLQAGKAVEESIIDLTKANCYVHSKFVINNKSNHCILHYVWNNGRENHLVLFSLKEEFNRIAEITDKDHEKIQGKSGTCAPHHESKMSEVAFEEKDRFLQNFHLKRFQFLLSNVYRSEEEAETEVAIPTDLLKKMQTVDSNYSFFFYILRNQKIVVIPASFDGASGDVKGPVLPKDVFCVVAEFPGEKITLGMNGGSFISETDDRIKVHVPAGALDSETDFTFRKEYADRNRYRQYLKRLPESFNALVGFPVSLSIEHGMKKPLKEKAKIYLPIIREGKDDEVLFVSWEDEKTTRLSHKEDQNSPDSPYYVEVDSLSTISAQMKSPKATLDDAIIATRLLLGLTSFCVVLTYVVTDSLRGLSGLLIDCVEHNRVQEVMIRLKEEGFREVTGCSRSKDCLMDEGGYVRVEIGGNLQLEQGIQNKDIKVWFYRNRSTNRIIVPVELKNEDRPETKIMYTSDKNEWEFEVTFNMADFVEKMPNIQKPKSGFAKLTPITAPNVLSEKSLSALGENLPLSTWHKVGLELDISDDTITAIFEAPKKPSEAGFRLLKYWLQTADKPYGELVDELISALEDIGRKDVAEIVRTCKNEDKCIRRAVFSGGSSR